MKAIIITLVALLSWCSTTQAATALPTIDEIQQIAYSKDGNLQAVTLNTWNPDENTWFAIYKPAFRTPLLWIGGIWNGGAMKIELFYYNYLVFRFWAELGAQKHHRVVGSLTHWLYD